MSSEIAALERALAEARAARESASQFVADARRSVAAARAAATAAEENARKKSDHVDKVIAAAAADSSQMHTVANQPAAVNEEDEKLDVMPSRRSPLPVDFSVSISVLGDSKGCKSHLPQSKATIRIQVSRKEPLEGCAGPEVNDFLGVYREETAPTPSAAQEEHLSVTYLDGAVDGEISVQLPSMLGSYYVWYVHASGTVVALSSVFQVTAGSSLSQGLTQQTEEAKAVVSSPPSPPLLASPTMFEKLSSREHSPPPYLLEVLPRISVVQLIVPLPKCLRARSSIAVSGRDVNDNELFLPHGWTPGIEFEGSAPDGSDAAIVFAMELPRLGRGTAYDAAPSDVSAFSADKHAGRILGIASLPRDLFLLRIPLSRRIERGKVVLTVFPDHVSVRLPLFFAGSVLPERPTSLVSMNEVSSLKSHGRELACRFCEAKFMKLPTSHDDAKAVEKVLLLPSEYWLEWSEYWLCHQGQENIFIPRDDEGELCALRGAYLVGETHVQVHVGDIGPGTIVLRPSSAASWDESLRDVLWWKEGSLRNEGDSSAIVSVGFDVECARCASVMGTLTSPLSRSTALNLSAALRSSGDAAFAVELFKSAETSSLSSIYERDEFPGRLTAMRHPTLRLHKDRLSLRPMAVVNSNPNRPVLRDTFELYATSSRLANTMLAAALAHGQYWFVCTVSSAAGTKEIRILIGLLNWNTAIRGASWQSSPPASAQQPWEKGGDIPAAKLRFRVLDTPLSEDDQATALAWGGSSSLPAQEVRLSEEEAADVIAMLGATMSLLPRSARVIDACSVGFLPFLTGPLRLT